LLASLVLLSSALGHPNLTVLLLLLGVLWRLRLRCCHFQPCPYAPVTRVGIRHGRNQLQQHLMLLLLLLLRVMLRLLCSSPGRPAPPLLRLLLLGSCVLRMRRITGSTGCALCCCCAGCCPWL
jgi:hypothetical protein